MEIKNIKGEEVKIEVKPIFDATVYCEEAKQQLRKIAEKFVNDGYTVNMIEETPKLNSYNHSTGTQEGRYLKLRIYDYRPPMLSSSSFKSSFPPFSVGALEDAGEL